MAFRFCLLLVLVLTGVPAAARFALLIGNADGGSDVVTLKFVDNDLKAVASTLRGYCGFKKEHIISIDGKGPREIERALETIERMLPDDEENLLLLYYTGHADREHLKMGESRFPITEMKQRFSSFPASIRIGIFDACQSGSFTRLKGGQLAEPFLFKDTQKIKGEVILSSSSPTENAQESDLYGNSIFTFHFVNALRGSGDLSGDGKVTLSEAYQYSYNHTVSSTARTWGGVQHPSYQFRIQGEGDVVLADLTVGTTGVLLEGSISGEVTMFDSSNNIVADLSKEAGSRMIIALNSGTYQIVISSGSGEKWSMEVAVQGKRMVPVEKRQFEKFDPVRMQHKGGYEKFRIGVSVSGAYGRFDLTSCAGGIKNDFSGFSRFGILPAAITDLTGPYAGIGLQLRVREQFTGALRYSRLSAEKSGTYSGVFSEPGDDREYGTGLDLSQRITIDMFDWSTGYHCNHRYFRGIILQAGVICFAVDMSVHSTFTSELYDVTNGNTNTDKGILFLPYIAGGYSFTLLRYIDLALLVRYRYQSKPKSLYDGLNSLPSGSVQTGHLFNLGGVDVTMSATFNFIRTGGGK